MSDTDLQEVGAMILGHLQGADRMVSRLDLAFDLEIAPTTVDEAIDWLYANGYLTHKNYRGSWGNSSITDAGREVCEQHSNNKAN